MRFLYLSVGLLFAGCLAWYFLAHPNTDTSPLLPAGMELSMHKVRYVRTNKGKVVWSLAAGTASKSSADSNTTASDVHAVLYLADGSKIAITARRGVMSGDKQTIRLMGDVRAVRDSGGELVAEEMTYSQKTGLIQSDSMVRFCARGITVSGRGMILDTRSCTVKLLNDVEVQIDENA